MYSIGEHDRVVRLNDVPKCDVGAPMPTILAAEHLLCLAYLVSEPDPNWDGTYVNVVSNATVGNVAIIEFQRPSLHMFGPPNDEAFSGHPLAKRGLRPYAASEILESSWLEHRIAMNRVHPYHSDEMFANLRHFVIAFHDSTFECLAKELTVTTMRGSIIDAITALTPKLKGL
jgi:hypothetical protein